MTATPTTAVDLLEELAQAGIDLWEDDGRLHHRDPEGALTGELRDRFEAHRGELLDLVRDRARLGELESAMAAIAAEVLGRRRVGGTESLTDLGADTLVIAKIAGRLHDELPAVSVLAFDAVLHELLNGSTVAAVAAMVRAAAPASAETAPASVGRAPADEKAKVRATPGYARMIRMGGTGAPVRVLIHAGPGTVDCFRPLATRLAAQELGTVMGIAVADLDTYCAIPRAEIVPRCADDYANRLLETGHRTFQMIGYCVGGIFSTEVALRLLDAGARIVDFTLIDSLPGLLDTDDELMIEATFMPDLGLAPTAAFGDLDLGDVMRAYQQVAAANDGRFPAGGFASVGGDPGLDAVRVEVARLTAVPQAERLAGYARLMAEEAGQDFSSELVPALYRMYRQSFLASLYEPPPYPGNIHYLRAEPPRLFPGAAEQVMEYWRRVCGGELSVSDIGGDHLSCVEEPHVADVATHLGAALTRWRSQTAPVSR